MERCEICGTENRGNAKFCRGCARALMPIEADAEAQKLASNRALRCSECQAIYSRGATVCAACGHPLDKPAPPGEADPTQARATKWPVWVVGAVVSLALVGAAGMWGMGGKEAGPGDEAHQTTQSTSSASAARMAALPAEPVEAAKPVAETLDEAQKAHYEELIRREAERAERARETMDRLAAKEKALSEARANKAAAERRRGEAAPVPPPEPANAIEPAPTTTPTVAAQPAPAVPAPARLTVEQACAKETNFLARDLCRVDACRVAANAGDPICVWYRRLEEERRSRLNN
jgi:hypothetical protein